jgi:benzylsuccinate CoA-transferase BbsF subunit
MTLAAPLAGLRVLDYCWVGAGAFVTKMLADHGAEVIKIESRARPDNLRVAPPFKPNVDPLEASGYFASRNSNKKSFALDMSHPEARRIAQRLAARCSVVTSNFRPGVMERWGLSYEDLRRENPSVIYLTMPMQGLTGPNKEYVGFGSTIAALSGLVERSGLPDRAPVGTGTHYPDHVPNPGHGVIAVLAAVYERARSGLGQSIEVAQLESTVNVLGPELIEAAIGGRPFVRRGNRVADAAPHGVFPCRGDDAWCAISIRTDLEWRSLVDVLDAPVWAAAPELATFAGRKAHEDRLEALVAGETRHRDRFELMRELQKWRVPAAAVSSADDLVADPHLRARGYWQRSEHAAMGPILMNGLPFKVAGRPRPELRAAPLLGEHTWEIAASVLDMDRAEYDRLVAERVFY